VKRSSEDHRYGEKDQAHDDIEKMEVDQEENDEKSGDRRNALDLDRKMFR
jgi:hypothetical protein